MSEDEAHFSDEEPDDHWIPVTGPLSPARAAVVALALEQAGIEVVFLAAEQHVFPTVLGGPPLGGQRLAVREPQVVAAREIVARTDTAFPLDAVGSPPRPDPQRSAVPPDSVPPESAPSGPSPEERAAEAAFESLRVRRYTQGLFIFVIGLVWTLAVLPRIREDALVAIIGTVILCVGLLRIYAALSLRKDEQEGTDGNDPSDRSADDDPSDRPETTA